MQVFQTRHHPTNMLYEDPPQFIFTVSASRKVSGVQSMLIWLKLMI